jgi:hypothetical protein
MALTPALFEQLQRVALELLAERVEGYSEYELLKALAEREMIDYGAEQSRDSLALYRAHFLLFHVLYRLRDQLRAERRGDMEINPLRIRLQQYATRESSALDVADPLRAYYLDWNNCARTTGADVNRMLGRFWIKHVRNDRRAEALSVLGLSDPVDDDTIKQTYRRLAMQHHPDRGGDGNQLREINAAVSCLLG